MKHRRQRPKAAKTRMAGSGPGIRARLSESSISLAVRSLRFPLGIRLHQVCMPIKGRSLSCG